MRGSFYIKEILLATILVSFISALALASDSVIYNIQGKVTEINLRKKSLTVYETSFAWNQNTIFSNEKGSPITIDKLKPQTWVYIECEYRKDIDKRIAKRVYLLPKPIEDKD
jgi:hypothetical protein